MQPQLRIIKISGNIIDDAAKLQSFLIAFAQLDGHKILVHGGGKLATQLADQLGVSQQMVEGRRITDADTLKIVSMVYAGSINKQLVASLQQHGCNAIGLSGADGNLIKAHKRLPRNGVDYGWVGDVDQVNDVLANTLLQAGFSLIVAPITHDGQGQLLNTNADTIAQEMAAAMSTHYSVELVYSFEQPGVLLDVQDPASLIRRLTPAYYQELKSANKVFAGMIPKLDNAFAAINRGVQRVVIGEATQLQALINGSGGTSITNG